MNNSHAFSILMVVLITIGIFGLVACSAFFIMNQVNINRAYQSVDINSINIDTISNEPSSPKIITSIIPSGMKGMEYICILNVTGSSNITWNLDAGNLPEGLNLEKDGIINGLPISTGTFDFTISVINDKGYDKKNFSIHINTVPSPPQISHVNLPTGNLGISYYQLIEGTGDSSITWKIVSGALPEGLNLSRDGEIWGIPIIAGTYDCLIKASNNAGSDEKRFSIIIEQSNVHNLIPIDPIEYVRTLSEAQTAASTKDIISLLYGFLSSAFIAVGLNFLRETQQAAKDTKDNVTKINDKYSEIKQKQTQIEQGYKEIEDLKINTVANISFLQKNLEEQNEDLKSKTMVNISFLQKNLEEQNQRVLLQTYIEQALICCRSIELLSLMESIELKGQEEMIYRSLPRIRDSMHWSVELLIEMNGTECSLSTRQIRILIRGVLEVITTISAIKNKCMQNKLMPEITDTWDEFANYANAIYKSLTTLRKRIEA